ncbi:hypothetical protein IFO70_38155 [Phormidium tenue FACHB-886]|nr:hypothetical protein [Phormidium tenue FACHB-886]
MKGLTVLLNTSILSVNFDFSEFDFSEVAAAQIASPIYKVWLNNPGDRRFLHQFWAVPLVDVEQTLGLPIYDPNICSYLEVTEDGRSRFDRCKRLGALIY